MQCRNCGHDLSSVKTKLAVYYSHCVDGCSNARCCVRGCDCRVAEPIGFKTDHGVVVLSKGGLSQWVE